MINLKFKKLNLNKKIFITPPSDKSISHRALLLNCCAEKGKAVISNFLFCEDTLRTLQLVKQLGIKIETDKMNKKVYMKKEDKLKSVIKEVYCGNSGTTCRLSMALIAGAGVKTKFRGDKSLSNRPMQRITYMLEKMGADLKTNNKKLPVEFRQSKLKKIKFYSDIGSAQQKSAFIIASLFAKGEKAEYFFNLPSRNHTEIMLKKMGADIKRKRINGKYKYNLIIKNKKLNCCNFKIPGDFSSASFFIVLGLLKSKNGIYIKEVNLNKSRSGLIYLLKKMGAHIEVIKKNNTYSESCGDIFVKKSSLKGIKVEDKTIIPALIDEVMLLALTMAFSDGDSEIYNIGELKYKECNRLEKIGEILDFIGIEAKIKDDFIKIYPKNKKNCTDFINCHNDHRIIMTALIAGVVLERDLKIDSISDINTSFPNFFKILKECGYEFKYSN
ncbi:MAG: 3-phosphoshikimate 1-carboxyvinyltransferase [Candidatus Muiribacteriota bacterium]